jgi:hypothetical protein
VYQKWESGKSGIPHDMTLYTTIGEFNSMKRPLDVDIMIGIGIFAVLAMAAYCRV